MSPEKQQAVQSVWTRPRKKKEQPALSVGQIVAEAIALLDADGLEQLSMRKLGARMNAGATSLYRHVANKDELIELVVDEVYGELEVAEAAGPDDWRAAATATADSLRSMMLRHPWVGSVLGQVGLKSLGPNLSGMSTRMMRIFQVAGFPIVEADRVMNTLTAYVIGMATSEAAWLSLIARSGMTEQEWVNDVLPGAMESTREHPELNEVLRGNTGTDPAAVRDENFAYGLERVLDGLEARLGWLGRS